MELNRELQLSDYPKSSSIQENTKPELAVGRSCVPNRPITPLPARVPPVLDPLRVDSRRLGARRATLGALGAAVVVDVFEVEGVNVAGEVAESEKKVL